MANEFGGAQQQNREQQQGTAESWQETMQQQVSRLSDQVQRQSAQLTDMAQGSIREWPVTAVLGAFAAGLAIGLLLAGAGMVGGRRSS